MIHFVVVDADGLILRFGQCQPEDAAIQGDEVLTFETDPAVSDITHRWNGEAFE